MVTRGRIIVETSSTSANVLRRPSAAGKAFNYARREFEFSVLAPQTCGTRYPNSGTYHRVLNCLTSKMARWHVPQL